MAMCIAFAIAINDSFAIAIALPSAIANAIGLLDVCPFSPFGPEC